MQRKFARGFQYALPDFAAAILLRDAVHFFDLFSRRPPDRLGPWKHAARAS